MQFYKLPYGKNSVSITVPDNLLVNLIIPKKIDTVPDSNLSIRNAIQNPINCYELCNKVNKSKVVITINDKTRPVPNNLLFPPLLKELENIGVDPKNISIIIANGTHVPMKTTEYGKIIDVDIIKNYIIYSHDCDNYDNLVYKGKTSRGTEVYVNKIFDEADVRIVVGDIEPHHFAGFSGGVKSAAIGVCGRKTINQNHALLMDPASCVGNFDGNPLRQDIEEIGQLINVDFALNAILNEERKINSVFFGHPSDVIRKGIEVVKNNTFTLIDDKYDLVIASAGGYPKDINLYQSQKALTHASLFAKDGGLVILIAACEEGVGSESYMEYMRNIQSFDQVINDFIHSGFIVGPHKAFQFAIISKKVKFKIYSTINRETLQKLLLPSIEDLNMELENQLRLLNKDTRVAILPFATATIPLENK